MSHEEKLRWLREHPKETITCSDLAKLLGGNAYCYYVSAKEGKMDLPHVWAGKRLKIFKQPLYELLGGKKYENC